MIWKFIKDRTNLVNIIVTQGQEIDRLKHQIEAMENRPGVDNFHQVKTPFDTEGFYNSVKKQVVDQMEPYITEEAHRALAQMFFRQEPEDRSPTGYVARHAFAEDVYEVHITFPELHRRMAVYPLRPMSKVVGS